MPGLGVGAGSAFQQGLAANRPAAAVANTGYFYLATDTNGGTLYQSTGSAWVQVAAGVSAPASSAFAFSAKTANYTVVSGDTILTGDATGGAFTFALPAASGVAAGKLYAFKKIDSSVNTVTIARAGADTIDGTTSQVLSTQYATLWIVSDGVSKWLIDPVGAAGGGGNGPGALMLAFTPPNNALYTWHNQTFTGVTSAVATRTDAIYFSRALEGTPVDQFSSRLKALPATPYTITTYFDSLVSQNYNRTAICLMDATPSNGIYFGQMYDTGQTPGTTITVAHGTDLAITAYDLVLPGVGSGFWYQITDDGTTRKYFISRSGQAGEWQQVYSQLHATPFVPTQIGFAVESRNATVGVGMYIYSYLEA